MKFISPGEQSIQELIRGTEILLNNPHFSEMFRRYGRENEIEHLTGLKKMFETLGRETVELGDSFENIGTDLKNPSLKILSTSVAEQTILASNA